MNRTTLLEKLKRKRAQGSPLAALLGPARVPALPLGDAGDESELPPAMDETIGAGPAPTGIVAA